MTSKVTPNHVEAFRKVKTLRLVYTPPADQFHLIRNQIDFPKDADSSQKTNRAIPVFPKDLDERRMMAFVKPLLHELGIELVPKDQAADGKLAIVYGTYYRWVKTLGETRLRLGPIPITKREHYELNRAIFVADVAISCPGAKMLQEAWHAWVDVSGIYVPPMDDKSLDSAFAEVAAVGDQIYKQSRFEPGFVNWLRQLRGPETVNTALQKIGRSDLIGP